MIGRREVITLLGGAAAAWPLAARAQQSGKVGRVGFLGPSLENPVVAPGFAAFEAELRRLGFSPGSSLAIERRNADDIAPGPSLVARAAELIHWNADVLLVNGPELYLQATIAASRTIPIVILANNYDPIERGYVQGLARPGGRITGLFYRQPELAAKQLELLMEAFPDRRFIAALWDNFSADQFARAERRAELAGIKLGSYKLKDPPYDFAAAFGAMAADAPQALHVLSSPLFTQHRSSIAQLAIAHRLPTMFIFKTYVEAGGLMSYGVDTPPVWRRAAACVAKVLRGADPGDLPVEQVANFEFAINLRTAKAIGVSLPTATLLRADEVIE